MLETRGVDTSQIGLMADFMKSPYDDQLKKLQEQAVTQPNPESVIEYLTTVNDQAMIAFFCLGGVFRSRTLVEEFKLMQATGQLENFKLMMQGHFPVDRIVEIIGRMEKEDPTLPKYIVIAYDEHKGEAAVAMMNILNACVRGEGFFRHVQVDEVMRGNWSSIGAHLVLVPMPD